MVDPSRGTGAKPRFENSMVYLEGFTREEQLEFRRLVQFGKIPPLVCAEIKRRQPMGRDREDLILDLFYAIHNIVDDDGAFCEKVSAIKAYALHTNQQIVLDEFLSWFDDE